MSEAPHVLLLGSRAQNQELLSLLREGGLICVWAGPETLQESAARQLPEVVVHLGRHGVERTIQKLESLGNERGKALVVVGLPGELSQLRELGRGMITSLLSSDLPAQTIAENIASLAHLRRADDTSNPVGKEPTAAELTVSSTSSSNAAGMRPSNAAGMSHGRPRRSSHHPPLPTSPMQQPPARHVLVADSDIMRGDAIARTLRQSGVITLLVPLDPAKTRWPLVRQFLPDMLVVDSAELKESGRIWHQLLLADQALGGIRLAAIQFDKVFDETTGKVNLTSLSPHLPELTNSAYRSPQTTLVDHGLDLADIDPSFIEEIAEADRFAMMTEANTTITDVRSALALALGNSAASDQLGLPAEVNLPQKPRPAMSSDPWQEALDEIKERRVNWLKGAALAVGLAIVVFFTGHMLGIWGKPFKWGPNRSELKAAVLPPKEVHIDHQLEQEPIIDPGKAPWLVPEGGPEVPSCATLLGDVEAVKKRGLAQADISWELAKKELVLGNVSEAHRHLCEASVLYPDGPVVEGLVEMLLLKHATGRAAEWLEKLSNSRPDRRKTLDFEGDVLCQLGRIDEAKTAWARALKVEPTDEKILSGWGIHYEQEGTRFLKNGNWSKAELLLRRAAALNPTSGSAAASLAQAFLGQDYLQLAKLWAEKSLELSPQNGAALVVQADLAIKQNNTAAALILYKQALNTDPGNTRAHQQIYRLTQTP